MAIGMKFAAQQLTKKQMNLVKGGQYLAICPYRLPDSASDSIVNYEQIWANTISELQEKMDNYHAPNGYLLGNGGCQYAGGN